MAILEFCDQEGACRRLRQLPSNNTMVSKQKHGSMVIYNKCQQRKERHTSSYEYNTRSFSEGPTAWEFLTTLRYWLLFRQKISLNSSVDQAWFRANTVAANLQRFRNVGTPPSPWRWGQKDCPPCLRSTAFWTQGNTRCLFLVVYYGTRKPRLISTLAIRTTATNTHWLRPSM